MTSAAFPLPVFRKNRFVLPSGMVVWIFAVDADDMPTPPWLDTEVWSGSRASSLITALSSFMVDAREDEWRRRDNMEIFEWESASSW